MNQSELEANTRSWCQARENASKYVTIGCGFTSDWLERGARFFSQSQAVVMQIQSSRGITFDTLLNVK